MSKGFEKQCPLETPGATILEAEGLNLISEYYGEEHLLKTPEVLFCDENILRTSYIDVGEKTDRFFEKLAFELSRLHNRKYDYFGLDKNNYIGLKPQINIPSSNWSDFFWEYRLKTQLEFIVDKDFKLSLIEKLNNVKKSIIKTISEHRPYPSLCHGDLWSGNVLSRVDGEAFVIDPAVYYGDREVDIAMAGLFGGFSPVFFESYMKEAPLEDGYLRRFEIYNLYHLLNHYNIFGTSYKSQVVEQILKISKN